MQNTERESRQPRLGLGLGVNLDQLVHTLIDNQKVCASHCASARVLIRY